MAMEKKPMKKLTEERLHEDSTLVSRLKDAQPGQVMTGDQFKQWLADFR